jgi:radical SAM superfamily enzyme YgiQ (UPF0313 family)
MPVAAAQRRRRVLLVNPRLCSRRSMRLPLSLLSLAAVLEGRHDYAILDGNRLDDLDRHVADALGDAPDAVAAISVMPGPQVAPAIAVSAAIRARRPDVPIVWGGYFPTLYPDAAINAPYVDYVVRGAGEDTLRALIARLDDAGGAPAAVGDVAGLTWKRDGGVVHNAARPFASPDDRPPLPYHRLDGLRDYLRPTFMGARTAVHQAAIGCR